MEKVEEDHLVSIFFFNDTAPTEIYSLSLHDALPISIPLRARPRARGQEAAAPSDGGPGHRGGRHRPAGGRPAGGGAGARAGHGDPQRQAAHRAELRDRKSTRLNSSHGYISYAVFCLKKKK